MREIALTQGKVALVDDEDYEHISRFNWYAVRVGPRNWYAASTLGARRQVYLHRYLLCVPLGMPIHHLSGDSLDNRRGNLRRTDPSNHMRAHVQGHSHPTSTSRFAGVQREARGWAARLMAFGKKYHLGLFQTEEEAAIAYNWAALQHHGPSARLNVL